MRFSALDKKVGAVSVRHLGDPVTVHLSTGRVLNVNAIIDVDVEQFAAGFAGVAERRTVIRFLKTDVPDLKRDDLVVDAAGRSYVLEDTISDDGVMIVRAAR